MATHGLRVCLASGVKGTRIIASYGFMCGIPKHDG